MKTLMLLRHAKSDWNAPYKGDHGRKLNARGEKAAPAMGAFMKERGVLPDEIWCSTATRTRQTCTLLTSSWEDDVPVHFSDALYGADERTLLAHATKSDPESAAALLIAHNPGMHGLALDLIGEIADGVSTLDLEMNLPTAALAVFTFDIDRWEDLAPHTGRLTCFQVPRKLSSETD